MAKLYRKKLVPVGEHVAPQGSVTVTDQRVKRWVSEFNQLRGEGVRFPVPYGHILKAIPAGDKETEKYAKARWNSGYIERLEQDPVDKSLVMLGTIPPGYSVDAESGDLVNPNDGTRIGEVSAGIGDWTDGKGRRHEDIILHAALVPLPVWAGQDHFAALATEAGEPNSSATFLATLGSDTMKGPKAKPEDDKKLVDDVEELAEATPDDEPTVDDLPALDEPTPEAVPTPDNIAAAPGEPLTMTADQVRKAIGLLGQMQFPLDPDTNPANFMDRFLTGLNILQKQGVTLSPKTGADAAAAPATINTDLTNAQPEAPQGDVGGGMGGMMMSTVSGKTITLDPLAHKFATAAGESLRRQLKNDWLSFGKDKPEPFKVFCEKEADALASFTLSLDPDTGAISLPEAVARLERTKSVVEALGHADVASLLTQTLSTATPEASPADGVSAEEAKQKLDEVAKRWLGDKEAVAKRF